MQGDEISARQHLVEVGLFNADFQRPFGGQKRVKGDHFHLQAKRARRSDGTDIAAADNAQRLAGQLNPHKARLLPFPVMGRGVGLRDLSRQREHHGDGVLCRGDGIAERRVHHHNAFLGGGGQVDIIDTDTGAADDFHIGRGFQHRRRGFGRRAHRHAVIIADDFNQFVLIKAGNHINIDAAIFENLLGSRAHFICNQYFRHFVPPFLR